MSVGQDDLRDMRDTILAEMRIGFAGVHARQDQTNGRVGRTETEIARIEERVKTIFRMFNRRQPKLREDDDPAEDGTAYRRSYPMKVLIPSIMAATVAISEALQRIIPALVELFK